MNLGKRKGEPSIILIDAEQVPDRAPIGAGVFGGNVWVLGADNGEL